MREKPIVVTSCSRYLPLSAFREGYEPGDPIGHGDTAESARANLLQLEEDERS